MGHTLLDSRGFSADLAMVPLFAVGEVFLVGAFELLHGTNIGPERAERQRRVRELRPVEPFLQSSWFQINVTVLCE